jgi:hypothetical protein
METRELEHQDADLRSNRLARLKKSAGESIRVQEVLVHGPLACAEARQVGEALDRDGVGHLEPEPEIRWHLRGQALEILAAGEGVVGRIHADGLEDLGVLGQAVLLEAGLGELAPVEVAGLVVDHAPPAWVLP